METVKRIIPKTIRMLRLLLAALFLYAGGAKLLDVPAFVAQIQRLVLENESFATGAAHYIPFVEIICGIALILRRFTLGAITLYMALLISFEVVLAHALVSGVQADCGCFGRLLGGASIQTAFIRNLGLFVVGLVVFWREYVLARRTLQ